MCMFGTPKTNAPVLPPERAAMRQPNSSATDDAGRRATDQLRAGTDTILTSGSGVTGAAPTEKKTLLGA